MNPLHITIRSTEDGHYRWELRDGPDGAFEYAGTAPLLERCFADILRAQWVLAEHLTGEADPAVFMQNTHTPPDLTPARVHTPHGRTLPAQQDVPPSRHAPPSTPSFTFP